MKKIVFVVSLVLTTFGRLFSQPEEPPMDSTFHYEYDSIYAQSPETIEIEAQTAVRFANSANVYLKWSPVTHGSNYMVMYSSGTGEPSWTMVQTALNEVVLQNIPLDVDLIWNVMAGSNPSTPSHQSDIGLVSTRPQTEPIKVSPRFYNKLEGWFSKDNNNEAFCDFLATVDVSQYEKLSFLQAYYFKNENFVKPTGPDSEVLSNWYPANTITGTGSGDECIPPQGTCNCKVITRGSNLATPNEKYDDVNYKILPKFIRRVLAFDPDGDVAMADRYEAGAAKFISLKQNISGWSHNFAMSNMQGLNDTSSATTEASQIVFFLACMRNGGWVTNLPESCECERPLHIYYEYKTRLHVKAEKRSCIWSKGAEATAEDLAFVALYEGKTGDLTPLKGGHRMLSASCSSTWNPQFWINVVDLLSPVASFYLQTLDTTQNRIPTSNQLTQFTNALKVLINSDFSNNSGLCDQMDHDYQLVNGSHTYNLIPNHPIRVALFSAYYVRTRGYGCWRAEAGVASDYYLMGVVQSQITENPECCADKFANYVVGSLSNPPSHPHYNLSAVNSIQNRLQDVGFILSGFGSWTGLDESPGSGIILLEHEYDRLYGPECDVDDEELGGGGEGRSTNAKLLDTDLVKVYPNATRDFLNIEINTLIDAQAQIRLLDLKGGLSKVLYSDDVKKGAQTLRFPVNEIPKGNYVVYCRIGEMTRSFKVQIL